ncbi:MAG: TM2 domain-containing protein [Spirochaetaceae bacterium]|jgi:TM2 domain-containing membrane protein YozV|nr:TM2 domain-containing protein [Spirochaetaceae bacterium]
MRTLSLRFNIARVAPSGNFTFSRLLKESTQSIAEFRRTPEVRTRFFNEIGLPAARIFEFLPLVTKRYSRLKYFRTIFMYSKVLAYLLWLLSGFGILGFHRFYLGKPLSALLWMFTGGLAGIGSLYDLFTLGSQVDQANMKMAMFNAASNYAANNGGQNWRYVNDGSARVVGEKNDIDRTILKIARKNGGVVTPSEVVIEGDVSLEKARQHLEKMVVDGNAEMRVRKSGVVVFTFPEFMDNNPDFEDF